jgi:glycosyltransferase involved in cell wall biosynthesis
LSSPKPIVIFYAPNVYIGGGRLLLLRALKELSNRSNLIAILNSHLKSEVELLRLDIAKIHWINGSLINYLAAEILLNKISNINSRILCFHGLPPILCKSNNIFIYAQNKLLFEKHNLFKMPFRLLFIIYIQKIILLLFSSRAKIIFVQTKTMKITVQDFLKINLLAFRKKNIPSVLIMPFVGFSLKDQVQDLVSSKIYDFIYPSTVHPHKNHEKLIEAWKILASENIFPSLTIPLTRQDINLDKLVSKTNKEFKTRIYILNGLSHKECIQAIQSSAALVYPSLSESFGLPLIEAYLLRIPILASNLSYVFDVCNPTSVFDPHSARSISESIKEFTGRNSFAPPSDLIFNFDKLDLLCEQLIT